VGVQLALGVVVLEAIYRASVGRAAGKHWTYESPSVARPLLLLTDGSASNRRATAAGAGATAGTTAAAAAAAVGELDMEYTALLEALLDRDDIRLGSGAATGTNRPPGEYQLIPNLDPPPNLNPTTPTTPTTTTNMRASLLSLFFAGAALALPKITRTGKYLYDESGSRFFIKVYPPSSLALVLILTTPRVSRTRRRVR
jgi:hypothetical protein